MTHKGIDLKVNFARYGDKVYGDITMMTTTIYESGEVETEIALLPDSEITYIGDGKTTLQPVNHILWTLAETGYDGETVHMDRVANSVEYTTYHYCQMPSYAKRVHNRVVSACIVEAHEALMARLERLYDSEDE